MIMHKYALSCAGMRKRRMEKRKEGERKAVYGASEATGWRSLGSIEA
jgi:hypothetical protein